jgi:hypothetical protein
MPHTRFSKSFTDTDRIVITQAEHQVPLECLLRLRDYRIVLYALLPDGTRVSLDADHCGGGVDSAGTLTIQLLTRRSGIVELWLPAPQAPLMR